MRGRRSECEVLDRLLGDLAAEQSSVLVLRGEAGIGKTALLEYVSEQASGCRILRAAGVESEIELAYAGLHQLCTPMLDRAVGLPGPQRDALRAAFGLQEGGVPEQFVVAAAVLSLLSEVAEAEPVVCLIDDAQWLDRSSARALAFVARRLLAERVAMVFAVREPTGEPEFAGLPELVVQGLPEREARLLLASGVHGRLDERVRDQIVAETRGNPLALLELPRAMTPADLAGGFGLPGAGSLTGRIEQVFVDRVRSLPPDSRQLLALAAADPLGDVTLLWRAAERLGIKPEASEAPEAAGMVEFGARVEFRHPLVRSAAYQTASPRDRRRSHDALAAVTDPEGDPDRRAWHRAQASLGLDEDVAAELERSAVRARRRGGAAAAAAFLARAAELTPDPTQRGARALAAAQAKVEAAAPEAASALLAMADLCPLDEYQRAESQRLRARVAFSLSPGGDALPLLLDAAQGLAALHSDLARDTYLEAFVAAMYAGDHADHDHVRRVAAAALADAAPSGPSDAIDGLVRGLATVFTEGFRAGVPLLEVALDAFRRVEEDAGEVHGWLWLACRIAFDLWDEELSREMASHGLRLAREAGALGILPVACNFRAGMHLHAGEFAAASALMEEAAEISRMTGTAPMVIALPMLAAYRGDETQTVSLLGVAQREAMARGQGQALSMLGCTRAVLFNGLARYEEALDAAEPACAPDGLGMYSLAPVELIEAAVRSGRLGLAEVTLERLAEGTRASNTDWALGIEARSRALLTEGAAAEALYEEALDRLSRGNVALHLARAKLVYGEWLRRENRRQDARQQLRSAHELFESFGAGGFAERARRELLATGETARSRSVETVNLLTPQETQVARLAADGLTNPDIGAQLFISPRTVEYHLRKIYPKLDISSRKDLRQAMARVPSGVTGGSD